MKIINAKWEKRNLGVDCNEVKIEPEDTVEILKKRSAEYETEYTVIKVPIGMIEISHCLQSLGYSFMELLTYCHNRGVLPSFSPIQKRIIKSVSCEEMQDKDIRRLHKELNNDMFVDDRVSLDPKFSQDQANRRYIGWISDDVKLGGKLFKMLYKGKAVGFFTFKKEGNDSYVLNLGGFYPSFEKFGFGICLNYHIINEGIKKSAKRISTGFSSNNRGASAIHFSLGLTLDQQYYVFVKHIN